MLCSATGSLPNTRQHERRPYHRAVHYKRRARCVLIARNGVRLMLSLVAFGRRAQFTQIVYAACSPSRPGMTDGFAFWLPPPAVLKPQHLWTGKQVALTQQKEPLKFSMKESPLVFTRKKKKSWFVGKD